MNKSVLIVDDDESSRFVLSRAIEGLGCRVVVAEDGAEVPALIATQRFDLLVLDLYMPGMNGFEVLRSLRGGHTGLLPAARTVRVLVVSGEGYAASAANARALGADAYLVKPFDLAALEDSVRKLLAAPASRRTASVPKGNASV